jgi:hypothetical protein
MRLYNMFVNSNGKGRPVNTAQPRDEMEIEDDEDDGNVAARRRVMEYQPDTAYLREGHWMERMQLMSMADALGIGDRFVSVMSADELPKYILEHEMKGPGVLRCALVNTDRIRYGGRHWVTVFWYLREDGMIIRVVDPRVDMSLCDDLLRLLGNVGFAHVSKYAAGF